MRALFYLLPVWILLIGCVASQKQPNPQHLTEASKGFVWRPSHLSLLQDKTPISCVTPTLKNVVLSARDRDLALQRADGSKAAYKDVIFMDDAVLMKAVDSEEHLLFHTREDGHISLVFGELFPLKESDCDDTGSSKTCRAGLLKRLYWAPGKLEAKTSKVSWSFDVSRYGYFPSDATYFLGTRNSNVSDSILVIDYGSRLNVLLGTHVPMNCKSP